MPRFGLCALLWLAWSAVVSAQGNDLSAPAGGRATLMGNTGVALGRDGSAPFYNPATIVRIRDERLAFAVNFYSMSLTDFPNWHQPAGLDAQRFGQATLPNANLFDSNFRPLPSTLCLFFTLEELTSLAFDSAQPDDDDDDVESAAKRPTGKKLALCFATLESQDLDVQAIRFRADTPAGPSAQGQSLLRRWSRTFVGPTYSISLSRRFAIGGSLQLAYANTSLGIRSEGVSAQLDHTGVSSALSAAGSGRSLELTGTLGATYRVGRVTLGASLRLPSVHLYGAYEGTFTQSYSDGGQPVSRLAQGSGSLRSAAPTRLALGVGIAANRLTLELDGALELPLQSQLRADLDVTTSSLSASGVDRKRTRESYAVSGRPVFNPSVGMEYFFTRGLSLLAGASANFSSLQPLDPVRSVGNLVQTRMSHVAASLGVGSYWPGGELLFGIQFDYGHGQALAVDPFAIPNDWAIVDVRVYNLLFVISGSTNLNSIVRVVNTIANGGKADDASEPAQSSAGAPARAGQPASSKGSGSDPAHAGAAQRLPNPDAREAEGVAPQTPAQPASPQQEQGAGTPDRP